MTNGKPGRACSVCGHKDRTIIDGQLLAGQKHADIARTHNLSNDAVSRHARRHVSFAIATRADADRNVLGDRGSVDLLASTDGLHDRLMRLLRRAEVAKDHRTTLLAIKEARGLLELRGRLTGEIDSSGVRIAVVSNSSPANVEAIRQRVLDKMAALSGPVRVIAAT